MKKNVGVPGTPHIYLFLYFSVSLKKIWNRCCKNNYHLSKTFRLIIISIFFRNMFHNDIYYRNLPKTGIDKLGLVNGCKNNLNLNF
jgi:hypothetical protein